MNPASSRPNYDVFVLEGSGSRDYAKTTVILDASPGIHGCMHHKACCTRHYFAHVYSWFMIAKWSCDFEFRLVCIGLSAMAYSKHLITHIMLVVNKLCGGYFFQGGC